MRKVLLMAAAGLVCLFAGSSLVYADDANVSDFIGEYIGDMPEVDKYANPDVMKLYFNDNGNLERYSGLFYGTTGTTICYEYTDYEISGNVMTCEYDGAFSPYTGPRSDISGGVHEYTLQDDGNISSDGHIWYRYLTGEEKAQQEQSRTLASADDTDFTEGKCSDDFGNDQFVEDSVVDYYGFEDMKDVQKMNFRYAYPEVIWSAEFGEVEDNSDEDDNTESEDTNGDGVKKLIFKGWDNDNQRYQYLIYSCKDKEVQYEDSFENWQNGGNGEIYVNGTAGRVIVNTRLADRQTWTLF